MRNSKHPALTGVIHLPPLPGSPRARLSVAKAMDRAARTAMREAVTLERLGFDAIILENFGDTPFHKNKVSEQTIAAMSVIGAAVRSVVKIRIGINVLRNDAMAALSIASVTGADFIRVNVLSGVAATDQGVIEGCAAELIRARADLQRQRARIDVWADALVKHAQSLSGNEIELAAEELVGRAMADAVIITGATTGRIADANILRRVSECRLGVPVLAGSGATEENIELLMPWIDGVIVGSALRAGGRAGQPLDLRRAKAFARAFRRARRTNPRAI